MHAQNRDNAFFSRLLRCAGIAAGMHRMVLLARLITALLHFYYVACVRRSYIFIQYSNPLSNIHEHPYS